MKAGFLYIVHVREFLAQSRPVYKVGRTINVLQRAKQYPKGSQLLWSHPVDDVLAAERMAIRELKHSHLHKDEYGAEYFEGNLSDILRKVTTVAQKCHARK